MNDETHRIGNSENEKTRGLMKMRCSLPTARRVATRFSDGHRNTFTRRRTFAASALSWMSAMPPP